MSDTMVSKGMVSPALLRVIGATFAYFLAVGALMPVLPRFVEGPLEGGDTAVGIVVGAFALTALLIRPWAGRWGDRRGRRILVVSGALVAAASMAGLVFAESVVTATLLRLLTGVGEALFFVGAISAVVDLSPEGRQGEGMSYFSLGIWSAVAIGPILGETVLSDSRFDLVWMSTAGLAVLAAILGWSLPETRSGPGGSDGPLFDRNAVRPGLILLASIWGLAGFTAFVPLHALEIGMTGSASVFLLYGVIMVTIRGLGAKLPDRLGPRRATSIALLASAAGLFAMALAPTTVGLFVGVAVFAIGQALAFPAVMLMAVRRAPADRRGAAVGTVSAALDLAFGFGGLSLGLVAESLGYPAVFTASGLVAVVGLVLMYPRPITRRATRIEEAATDASSA